MAVQENEYQPLAGDPDHLQRMASHYLEIADAIRRTVPVLKSMHDGSNTSQATDALKDSTDKVADDIQKAESRYRVTAQALLDYVPTMRTAKTNADHAAAQIVYYSGQVDTTSTALHSADDALKNADDDGKDDATTAQQKAQNAADDAKTRLAHWQNQWHEHAGTRNQAAMTASGQIVDVVEHHNNGLKNPTHHWWDAIVHFAEGVWNHLDDIASWLGIASLLLGWIPIVGQVLLIATAVVYAIKLIHDVATGAGWKAILGDVVGLALTVVGGGAAKYLAKAGKFRAMEEAMGGTTNAAARTLGNDSKAFKAFQATFKSKPMQFAKAARGAEHGTENVLAPGMKSFASEVKASFKMTPKNVLTEGKNYLKSAGGLNMAKLAGKNPSFADSAGIYKSMSTMDKVAVIGMDGRKVLSNTQIIQNAVTNAANGNWSMDPKGNPHPATLSPEKLLIKALPGGA